MHTTTKKVISILLTVFFICNIFSPTAFASQNYLDIKDIQRSELLYYNHVDANNEAETVVEPLNSVTNIVKSAITILLKTIKKRQQKLLKLFLALP